MGNHEFRQLGGESLSINPENGEITLQTNLGVQKPNSSEVHHDALVLNWLACNLDSYVTTMVESVNNLLLRANAASKDGENKPWDEFFKDQTLTYHKEGHW